MPLRYTMGNMGEYAWLVWGGLFVWVGFTFGYFFRKWLETTLIPRFQAHQAEQSHEATQARDKKRAKGQK